MVPILAREVKGTPKDAQSVGKGNPLPPQENPASQQSTPSSSAFLKLSVCVCLTWWTCISNSTSSKEELALSGQKRATQTSQSFLPHKQRILQWFPPPKAPPFFSVSAKPWGSSEKSQDGQQSPHSQHDIIRITRPE